MNLLTTIFTQITGDKLNNNSIFKTPNLIIHELLFNSKIVFII